MTQEQHGQHWNWTDCLKSEDKQRTKLWAESSFITQHSLNTYRHVACSAPSETGQTLDLRDIMQRFLSPGREYNAVMNK